MNNPANDSENNCIKKDSKLWLSKIYTKLPFTSNHWTYTKTNKQTNKNKKKNNNKTKQKTKQKQEDQETCFLKFEVLT